MTQEQWESMTPAAQSNHCWRELTAMLAEVMNEEWQAGNASTRIIPGLTTLVGEQT